MIHKTSSQKPSKRKKFKIHPCKFEKNEYKDVISLIRQQTQP